MSTRQFAARRRARSRDHQVDGGHQGEIERIRVSGPRGFRLPDMEHALRHLRVTLLELRLVRPRARQGGHYRLRAQQHILA